MYKHFGTGTKENGSPEMCETRETDFGRRTKTDRLRLGRYCRVESIERFRSIDQSL